jgi:hypothetical protein
MVGAIVVYYLPTRTMTWISLLFLLSMHLMMNHAAVRAVKMRSLNRQRANILFSNLVEHGTVLTPKDVSERESIFERRGGGVFRWISGAVIGYCEFGISLRSLLQCLPQTKRNHLTGSLRLGAVDLSAVMDLFRNQEYILWCQTYPSKWYESSARQTKVLVVLKQGITPESQLRAWYHALLLARRLSSQHHQKVPVVTEPQKLLNHTQNSLFVHIASTLDLANRTFDGHAQQLRDAGWELDVPVLETRPGSRIICKSKKEYAQFGLA